MQLLRDELLDAPADEFDDYRRAVNANALRLGGVIAVAVQVPFMVYEWLAIPDDFWLIQALRLLWVAPLLVVFPRLREPSPRLLRSVDAIL